MLVWLELLVLMLLVLLCFLSTKHSYLLSHQSGILAAIDADMLEFACLKCTIWIG